jgi:hypothetical protein
MSDANRVAGYPDAAIASSVRSSYQRTQSALMALEAEYPEISYRSAGPLARLFSRAPVSPRAAEYRRLSAKIRDNDARREEFFGGLKQGPGVREELLEHYYRSLAPEFDADEAAMAALLRSYPNAKYEAAGPIRRLILRLTGRGPKS